MVHFVPIRSFDENFEFGQPFHLRTMSLLENIALKAVVDDHTNDRLRQMLGQDATLKHESMTYDSKFRRSQYSVVPGLDIAASVLHVSENGRKRDGWLIKNKVDFINYGYEDTTHQYIHSAYLVGFADLQKVYFSLKNELRTNKCQTFDGRNNELIETTFVIIPQRLLTDIAQYIYPEQLILLDPTKRIEPMLKWYK